MWKMFAVEFIVLDGDMENIPLLLYRNVSSIITGAISVAFSVRNNSTRRCIIRSPVI